MPLKTISNTFSRGELDPSLLARFDIDLYTKGARKLRNMISLWTGAATLAPGTLYTDTIVDRENSNTPITDATEVSAFDFLYDEQEEVIYTIILRKSNSTSSAIDIYYNNSLQATVTTPTYLNTDIKDVHFAIGHDRVLFLHENYQVRELIRVSAHASWAFTMLSFPVPATFDYSTIGRAVKYDSFTFTLGATSGSSVSLTSSSAVFSPNHVGGLFIGNGGVARITAVAASGTYPVTGATVRILTTFTATSVRGELSILQETMWNNGYTSGGTPDTQKRGWPARGAFYLNRLALGRSLELRNVCAFSTAGVFDNFDFSEINAVSAFSATFNGKGEQSIQNILADDSLIFLTSNKVFAQSPLVEQPLNAETFYFAPQSHNPSSSVDGVTIDNQALYVDATNTMTMQLSYDTGTAKYLGVPAGILSPHLFDVINSNATWDPDGIPTRLYMATQQDGSMLMYSSLVEQNIASWSLRTTRGNFKQVIGDNTQASVIVERQINLGNSTFETSIDYAYLSDTSFTGFYDVTTAFSNGATTLAEVFENQFDYILLGDDIPFTAIDLTFDTVSSDDCDLLFEYLDVNGTWNIFTPTDDTTGFTSSNSITWTFDDVINWNPADIKDIEQKYWIRIRRQEETVSTLPVVEDLEVNTGTRLHLENLGFNYVTDATEVFTSDANGLITGLEHLAGNQVYTIIDGATDGPYFVDSSGEVTIKDISSVGYVGIEFKPLLIPMPVYTPTREGDATYTQKYVQDLFIDYYDSLYLRAGIGERLTDIGCLPLNNYTLGESVSPQTGVFKMNPHGSWEPRQEIKITQSQPGPMTIIGVGYHVEVS